MNHDDLSDEVSLTVDLSTKKMRELISLLRVIVFEGDFMILKLMHLEATIRNERDKVDYPPMLQIKPFSLQNEISVWSKIGAICSLELEQYQTTYDDDIFELKEGDIKNENHKNILVINVEMK